ncbi:MAG: hypothetical protein LBT95_01020 [Treponema sp.]|jgi:hypothetical protein|nr:hypothetical protein [Treponema sp.]
MKKKVLPLICGVFCCFVFMPAFAESAQVLPARAFSFEIASSFTLAEKYYDIARKYNRFQEKEGAFKTLNLGFSAAAGITDWLTATVKWNPGWNVWSRKDQVFMPSEKILLTGFYDILAEIKVQIAGPQGLFKKRGFRFALAPEFKIPLPGPNYAEQEAKLQRGEPIIMENLDRHVFGLGGRIYFDYLINKMFSINILGEAIFYPVLKKLKDVGFDEYLYAGPLIPADSMVRYLGDLNLKGGVYFAKALSRGLIFGVGLPLNYMVNCGTWYYSYLKNRNISYLLSLQPDIGLFFFRLPVPVHLRLGYSLPLLGMDQNAVHVFALSLKIYFMGKAAGDRPVQETAQGPAAPPVPGGPLGLGF